MDRAVICDLDGVVYQGSEAVPGSPQALQRLRDLRYRIVFATNNSSRTPDEVARKITDITGVCCDAADVVTSGQAAVLLIPESATRCLVIGGAGLKEAVARSGRQVVASHDGAECVLVGIDRDADYDAISEAATAVRNGAAFIASNVDPTFPTPGGLRPGAGALVAAVAVASGYRPKVAGKPEGPMRALIRKRGIQSAWVIGDRIDTDIEMAVREPDWTSILVLSGVTGGSDDAHTADFVVDDLAAAVDLVLSTDNRQ